MSTPQQVVKDFCLAAKDAAVVEFRYFDTAAGHWVHLNAQALAALLKAVTT